MTETAKNGAEPAAAAQPKMQILGQFIRDMSFENFLMQKGVTGEVTPDIQVQVALDAKKRPVDHQFEVITKFTVRSTNKSDNAPLFRALVERLA